MSWRTLESKFDSWEGKEIYRFPHSVEAYIIGTKGHRHIAISATSTALVKNEFNSSTSHKF
jgi:hypothetical protein